MAAASSASSTSAPPLLELVFNHVALPPQLPAKQDGRNDQIRVERALTDRLLDASRTLRDNTRDEFGSHWERIRHLLQTCKTVNAGAKLDRPTLLSNLRTLERNDLVILHVAEQNAGLLIRRLHNTWGESVVFEAFEASPLSENVLASKSALQWDFPACAVAIPFSKFIDPSFLDNLAAFLEQASTESVKRFAARAGKAGSFAPESRDTVDPALITQMLMTLLEANGHRIFPPLLRKRVRDDVCWTDGAEKPWRRCTFWLVLRVGVQRQLCTLLGGELGRVHYKFLICLVLARLLIEGLDHYLNLESLAFLKTKLCRRLAKLEVDKERTSPSLLTVYEYMFATLGPLFHETTRKATRHIESTWATFKSTIQKPIPALPPRASQRDIYLTLPNSGSYLQRVLEEYQCSGPQVAAPYRPPANYDISAAIPQCLRDFTDRYFSLSELEIQIERSNAASPVLGVGFERRCIRFAEEIGAYLSAVADAYDSYPEQKSVLLLTVMELWVSMDECATSLFSLLKEYNPGFPAEILDVLQLAHFRDMCRLQKIQKYLQNRHKACGTRRTVFDYPTKGCFAERYFNESHELQKLQQHIEAEAEVGRKRKEQEWQKKSTEYEGLMKKVAESTCLYMVDDWQILQVHDDHRCTKCYLERQAKRMKIQTHEHPLPSNPIFAKAVVFELDCPRAFTAYRDATWRIIGTLAHQEWAACLEPRVTLRDYSETSGYMNSAMCSLSLASTAKSFLRTHYSASSFPVGLNDVCLPNGLNFAYFDTLTKKWPGRQPQKPNFAHHCDTPIPSNSPFSVLQSLPAFRIDANGPSSYEVIASQAKCPPELNVHEFMAYQSLFSGSNRRWLSILIELGSSNLNFSTEATSLLISRLALQVGPACEGGDDPLRIVHAVFCDKSFCGRLIEQIGQRLDGISSNWREIHCMEMLVTLVLRLCSLAPESTVVSGAINLLERARTITFKWISLLRVEICGATDASVSRKCSGYAFGAALLCRRTFDFHVEKGGVLQPTALRCFIECSIALQDNLVGDPAALPSLPKGALIRDLKMVYRLRHILRESLQASPGSLMSAINIAWPEPEGGPSRSSPGPKFLPHPDEWWTELAIDATPKTKQQTIYFHLLEGHLLIDGQPLGKLPAEHRKSRVLEQLFGNQSLLTYPSGVPGMAYMLALPVPRHEIHLGFRNGDLFARAFVRGSLLEFIPRDKFVGNSNFDLPESLIDGCAHWLNLDTGVIEIRPSTKIWRLWKPGSNMWAIDFRKRLAWRRRDSLVDPQGPLFQRVARIFDRFEHRRRLTVFQPAGRRLSVGLRRLQLSFHVNRRGLLQCNELRSEIDVDQDAGTWYGLNGKLVLRDVINPRQRSILTPMGALRYRRNGPHVYIDVENEGQYGRFTINSILGRLDCPAEPRLLYLKAQFHAYTSFVVPDPLTGRTGTEEALHCLKSGFCQPWAPLRAGPLGILRSIAKLTPRRCYYPSDMRYMQEVFWDPQLTTTIQHDGFGSVVDAISGISEQLSVFAFQKTELPTLEPVGDPHLLYRSYSRRRLFERPDLDSDGYQAASDHCYHARDQRQSGQGRLNVFECASLFRDWPPKLPTTSDLAGILQNWAAIGGYDRIFEKVLLSDRIAVEFPLEWGSLVNLCRASEHRDRYRLMFLFAVMSFRDGVDMSILRTLIAFSVLEDLKALDPPQWPSYVQFRSNQVPRVEYITQLIKPCCVPYPGDERSIFQTSLGSKLRRKLEAAERAHGLRIESECKAFSQFLLEQWPCPEPAIDGLPRLELVDITQALEIIRPEWLRFFQNLELSRYTHQVQRVLDSHHIEREFQPPHVGITQEVLPTRGRGGELPTLSKNLLRKAGPIQLVELHPISNGGPSQSTDRPYVGILETWQNGDLPQSSEIQELESIVGGIIKSKSAVRQRYGQDMMHSLNELKTLKGLSKQEMEQISPTELSAEILKTRQIISQQFGQLCKAFENQDSRTRWLLEGGIWPCITPVTVLEQLRSTSTSIFGDRMKESLTMYALSITALQRLMRMEDAHLKGNTQRLLDEQENTGHSNWDPLKHPDWLLLEIDANILIRHDQVDVAFATISPTSKSNSVLQMNMGQGKTSCIMPMVAAVLADTKKLLRVVVPKSLLLQTAQLLHARLGGLLGREVRHIPFSRRTPTDPDTIKAFYNIHNEIRKSSSVMLCLPEHILSFMLSGLQRLSDGIIPEASTMIKVQAWMRKVCRDVLDECDFTLAVRTQLIYPSGPQSTVDGHPHRWETAEALLRLVEGHLWGLQNDFPRSIEVVQRPKGGFPVVFFLRKDVEDALIARLVDDICGGRTSVAPIRDYTKSDRLTIRIFISEANVQPKVAERIHQMFSDKPTMKQNIYLLRGLLVHRILLLALKRRWNVQYGLHPSRDPIAVPFHAKGVPSEQAEWGHPDVAILFTCLAFYYGGLNITQLRQSLEHVLKSDDPSSEYDRWTCSSGELPGSLREWNAINADDESQLTEIWQHLRYNIVTVDHFLNNFVFPKHAKQFHKKLQASGWDIPLFSIGRPSINGRETSMTTGFSGTNDNRAMMPLTIKQEDLAGLSHTNAEVLTYLLQRRSRQYVLAADARGKHLSERGLLEKLYGMGIRILIDAGAQILEMDNYSLVKEWLSVDWKAPAAVYFDNENKPFVLYRNGQKIPLLATPLAENLGGCLVYLDEAHTRGTDLKMMPHACGALTLGLGQSKDHTVQAAMRLRQLGTSQSVVFFAPPEVHQSILDARRDGTHKPIDSHDVICWLLEQTCSGIEQLQPLYFSQGTDFCRRTQAASNNPDFLITTDQREGYLEALLQTEKQTLVQLYEPRTRSRPFAPSGSLPPEIAAFMKELNTRRRGFQDTNNAVHGSALQEVEQEREVAFEVEAVREVQKQVHYGPLSFPGLNEDVLSFAKTGKLLAGSTGYEQAFGTLKRTTMGQKYGIISQATTSKLYVSTEFTRTRQVNWMLWSPAIQTALIVIPEEAEELMPLLYETETPVTHLLTYATPVTRKMLHFNDLKYYSIPSLPTGWQAPTWLTIELGIFAGRLYFEFKEYNDLREYLGFREFTTGAPATTENALALTEHNSTGEAAENVIEETETDTNRQTQSFTKKPLTFLQEWLAVRRKGQDFVHTPMGYVCHGKPLAASHPFFSRLENYGSISARGTTKTRSGDLASDEEDCDDDGFYFDAEDGDGVYDEGELDGEEEDVAGDVGCRG
ncbi:MAG: hypothetical protein M1840_007729 [Geoglossum simile]|nr:MAG: hypothetical protein M1840_007729 [Geoglossum simile]